MAFCAPQLVYSNGFLNQTSSIGTTALFTPSGEGFFRISVYSDGNAGSGAGDAQANLTIVSAVGQNYTFGADGGAGSGGLDTSIFHLNSSHAVSLTVTLTGTLTYNVYVTIEQLV